ncbi:MAG: heme-binding protein [Acidobacteriota bacterium]
MPFASRRVLVLLGLAVWSAGVFLGTVRVSTQVTEVQLTAAEVTAVISAAATALGDATMAVAVVDRAGRILGVYARSGADAFTPDTAVTTARAAALFSNADAPLSSRTIRFISGIHFPPGVPNTPNAELYGIENTNRGCQLDAVDSAPFALPRSIAGSGLAGTPALPCRPSDTRGCAIGNAVELTGRASTRNIGFSTGKNDVLDLGQPLDVPVNPGGFALYRNGRVIGGIGVAGVPPDFAEYAAFIGAAGTASQTGISGLSADPLPVPGAVFIDGLRLPFFGSCISVQCVRDSIRQPPPRATPGTFVASDMRVAPRAGLPVPEGYLIGPFGSTVPGSLTVEDVRRLVDQAVARANVTRAQIRLPLTKPTSMVIAVSDETGRLLAAFRMPDSTIFSFDVATAKARNAYYFSSREGYNVLRSYVDNNPYDDYSWEPEPPAGQGWAVTNRTLSFGGQPLFPPGIDLEKPPTPGPFFDLFVYDTANPCTEGPGLSRGANRQYINQSGIVWFPGSAPLYKNGRLVGGIGVSGDGVSQDDYVTGGAVVGFEPPAELRVDRSVIKTGDGDQVRLPYFKFPRNPELR